MAIPELANPAHQRLVTELLAWDEPRPQVEAAVRDRLQAELSTGLEAVAEQVPAGERLFLGKSSLSALVCDGRYLDQEESEFVWSPQLVGGKLAHRAIELDLGGRRDVEIDDVVEHAWREMATDRGKLADWINALDRVAASAVQHAAMQRVADFRDTWPLLPAAAQIRLEHRMEVTAGEGAVVIRGTPDIMLGAVRDDRARMLLVDLKTGMRNPMVERQDMRFYALLATMKYGIPPFRWATYYVSEGAWDYEDYDEILLTGAVQRVIHAAQRAAVLQWERPAPSELRLVPGAWCRFCGRREDCPVAPDAQSD